MSVIQLVFLLPVPPVLTKAILFSSSPLNSSIFDILPGRGLSLQTRFPKILSVHIGQDPKKPAATFFSMVDLQIRVTADGNQAYIPALKVPQ